MRRFFPLLILTLAISLLCCAPKPAEPPASAAAASKPAALVLPTSPCGPLTTAQLQRQAELELHPPQLTGKYPEVIDITDFDHLCQRERSLICTGGPGRKLTRAEVVAVDQAMRAVYDPRDDAVQFGLTDYWTALTLCGDCEDYALGLAERLHRAGAAGQTMRLVVWAPEPDYAHVTLAIDTADAGEIEVGVLPTDMPQPIDWKKGVRFATIRLDGRREVQVIGRARLNR